VLFCPSLGWVKQTTTSDLPDHFPSLLLACRKLKGFLFKLELPRDAPALSSSFKLFIIPYPISLARYPPIHASTQQPRYKTYTTLTTKSQWRPSATSLPPPPRPFGETAKLPTRSLSLESRVTPSRASPTMPATWVRPQRLYYTNNYI
jgi:hypothetical protein